MGTSERNLTLCSQRTVIMSCRIRVETPPHFPCPCDLQQKQPPHSHSPLVLGLSSKVKFLHMQCLSFPNIFRLTIRLHFLPSPPNWPILLVIRRLPRTTTTYVARTSNFPERICIICSMRLGCHDNFSTEDKGQALWHASTRESIIT